MINAVFTFLIGIGGLEALLFFLIVAGLWLWALIDIIRSKKDSTTKIIWVVVILVVPLIGSILYLVFGRR